MNPHYSDIHLTWHPHFMTTFLEKSFSSCRPNPFVTFCLSDYDRFLWLVGSGTRIILFIVTTSDATVTAPMGMLLTFRNKVTLLKWSKKVRVTQDYSTLLGMLNWWRAWKGSKHRAKSYHSSAVKCKDGKNKAVRDVCSFGSSILHLANPITAYCSMLTPMTGLLEK